ncbi:hypothetical protein Lal_00033528 [Lupinus albus]|nr:hypothetical protein Lal_00033528 [Lupinus albus]
MTRKNTGILHSINPEIDITYHRRNTTILHSINPEIDRRYHRLVRQNSTLDTNFISVSEHPVAEYSDSVHSVAIPNFEHSVHSENMAQPPTPPGPREKTLRERNTCILHSINPEIDRTYHRRNTGILHSINPEIDRTYHRVVRQNRTLDTNFISVSEHPVAEYSDSVHSFAFPNFDHSENMAQPPTPPGPRERTLRERNTGILHSINPEIDKTYHRVVRQNRTLDTNFISVSEHLVAEYSDSVHSFAFPNFDHSENMAQPPTPPGPLRQNRTLDTNFISVSEHPVAEYSDSMHSVAFPNFEHSVHSENMAQAPTPPGPRERTLRERNTCILHSINLEIDRTYHRLVRQNRTLDTNFISVSEHHVAEYSDSVHSIAFPNFDHSVHSENMPQPPTPPGPRERTLRERNTGILHSINPKIDRTYHRLVRQNRTLDTNFISVSEHPVAEYSDSVHSVAFPNLEHSVHSENMAQPPTPPGPRERTLRERNTSILHSINPEIDRTYHRLVRQNRTLDTNFISVSEHPVAEYSDSMHSVAFPNLEHSVHSENMAQPPTPPGPRERTLRERNTGILHSINPEIDRTYHRLVRQNRTLDTNFISVSEHPVAEYSDSVHSVAFPNLEHSVHSENMAQPPTPPGPRERTLRERNTCILHSINPEIDRTYHRLVRQNRILDTNFISVFEHLVAEYSDSVHSVAFPNFEHSVHYENMAQPPTPPGPRERTLRNDSVHSVAFPNFEHSVHYENMAQPPTPPGPRERTLRKRNTCILHSINPEIDRTYHRLVRQNRTLDTNFISVSEHPVTEYSDSVNSIAFPNFDHSENMGQPPTPPGPRERTLRERNTGILHSINPKIDRTYHRLVRQNRTLDTNFISVSEHPVAEYSDFVHAVAFPNFEHSVHSENMAQPPSPPGPRERTLRKTLDTNFISVSENHVAEYSDSVHSVAFPNFDHSVHSENMPQPPTPPGPLSEHPVAEYSDFVHSIAFPNFDHSVHSENRAQPPTPPGPLRQNRTLDTNFISVSEHPVAEYSDSVHSIAFPNFDHSENMAQPPTPPGPRL